MPLNRVKLSIVIPVYNVENYLRKCIDSVLNQDYDDYEIILVDDGSPDKSGTIAEEYAARDKRFVVIHKENGGYGKAMNVGIDYATGEYIGIVEPDDYVELHMFETLYNKAIETNVDFIKSDFYQFNENLQEQVISLDHSGKYYNYKVYNARIKCITNIKVCKCTLISSFH